MRAKFARFLIQSCSCLKSRRGEREREKKKQRWTKMVHPCLLATIDLKRCPISRVLEKRSAALTERVFK